MAVVTESYTTAGGNYTAANLATAVGDALIDTGIMTGWHDSGTSGSLEYRVLEVTYDASKTYGKTYYIFLFSGADMFYTISSGWNGTSNIPAGVGGAGTQYVDWFSTTLSTANACRITASTTAGFNNLQSAPVKRFTSTDRANFSVIQITNGTTNVPFFIERTAPNSTLVDLDKVLYSSIMFPRLITYSLTAAAGFQAFPARLRRSHLGAGLRGSTAPTDYGMSATMLAPWEPFTDAANLYGGRFYGAPGNDSSNTNNSRFERMVDILPIAFANTNPSYATDLRPPFTGMLLDSFSSATLPADFAIIPVYTSNTMQPGEQIVITAGVEVYDIISVVNAGTLGRPSMVFAARTT
jgi:hypothetical protein